jgi:hypothetical protein
MKISVHISLNSCYNEKNVSDKNCTETRNTNFIFNNVFSKIVPWKIIVDWGRPHKTTGRKRIAIWVPKATN